MNNIWEVILDYNYKYSFCLTRRLHNLFLYKYKKELINYIKNEYLVSCVNGNAMYIQFTFMNDIFESYIIKKIFESNNNIISLSNERIEIENNKIEAVFEIQENNNLASACYSARTSNLDSYNKTFKITLPLDDDEIIDLRKYLSDKRKRQFEEMVRSSFL